MRILELFAGSGSVGNVAREMGWEVFSVDWGGYEGVDLVKDIGELVVEDVPWVPDVIWASPDCTTYTIAAVSHHRNGVFPTSDYAIKCDFVNNRVLGLIDHWLGVNIDLKFFIENPRGMMRKMPWMGNFDRATVCYCRYGDTRMKPTDIWSNHIWSMYNEDGWRPRPMCFNGNKHCHHEAAPRGSKTGTQGLSDAYDRSVIPRDLCIEILGSVLKTQPLGG